MLLIGLQLDAQEGCQEIREKLKALEAQKRVDDATAVFAWITLSRSTSNNGNSLEQRIGILRLELAECTAMLSETPGE